jgi:S-methylmethionine-dependent homocysteine/selenocysteine methylase
MSRRAVWPYRGGMELTDGGLETTLTFHEGIDLPCFAAFPLLEDLRARGTIRRYFDGFLELADERGAEFVLDTVTWRANPHWGRRLGYDAGALATANRRAVEFAQSIASHGDRVLVNGVVGPRADGYLVAARMSADEAAEYHSWQVAHLASAGVERITALTLTYPEEATGVVRAAATAGVPAVVSFTVETDGRLPDGTPVAEAIAEVDGQTAGAAEFFMVNCAHPSHIACGLDDTPALARIGGLRVNASALSHAELDAMDDLDAGDPVALARENAALASRLPAIRLLGGCCGTDIRHVSEIAAAW